MSLEKKREFKPLPGHTIQGDLNAHYPYTDETGDTYLRRVSRENPNAKKLIRREIKQWGFNKEGGKISLRTSQEQLEFQKKVYELGLRVLPIFLDERGESYSAFLENAVTLDKYLPEASEEDVGRTLKELFDDLTKAHHLGIVYGDRWPKNILVDQKLGVVHIDFDLELQGPGKELELAQIIFYALAVDPNRSTATLKPILENMLDDYNCDLVKEFLMRKVRKSQKKYGDLTGVVRDLFDQFDKNQTSSSA